MLLKFKGIFNYLSPMNFIQKNIQSIQKTIPQGVTLVAVSKTHSVEFIQQAYEAGQRVFGENKIQELTEKYEQLPKDIQWHMIGHLQRNKIKYIAPFVHLIHGVDDFKKLVEIDKQAKKNGRVIDCLLQIKIAQEDTKFGLSMDEALEILTSRELLELKNLVVKGFMGMASFTDDTEQVKQEFSALSEFYKKSVSLQNEQFFPTILSMGMSGDYQLAIEQGSTMVRVGSAIFGNRNYNI